MKLKVITAFAFLVCQAAAFLPATPRSKQTSALASTFSNRRQQPFSIPAAVVDVTSNEIADETSSVLTTPKRHSTILSSMGGTMIGLFSSVGVALADSVVDADQEIADLPPPYIPVLVAFALLAGVGLLTGSLGDVMLEEARLGDMSGARAKKEMERSRSSYFKKK